MKRLLSALLLLPFAALAQYPDKPVRIVTSEVGGSQDVVARMLSAGLSAPLGQQLIVDNRPSGVIPGDIVSKARPDGKAQCRRKIIDDACCQEENQHR